MTSDRPTIDNDLVGARRPLTMPSPDELAGPCLSLVRLQQARRTSPNRSLRPTTCHKRGRRREKKQEKRKKKKKEKHNKNILKIKRNNKIIQFYQTHFFPKNKNFIELPSAFLYSKIVPWNKSITKRALKTKNAIFFSKIALLTPLEYSSH